MLTSTLDVRPDLPLRSLRWLFRTWARLRQRSSLRRTRRLGHSPQSTPDPDQSCREMWGILAGYPRRSRISPHRQSVRNAMISIASRRRRVMPSRPLGYARAGPAGPNSAVDVSRAPLLEGVDSGATPRNEIVLNRSPMDLPGTSTSGGRPCVRAT